MQGMAAPAVSPLGQGRIYFDSTSMTFKVSEDGGGYVDLVGAGGGGGGGVLQGKTASSYDGNVTSGLDTGYVAINDICNAEYAGSHFCQTDEVLNTINSEDISGFSGTAWVAEGPPGYIANANDCIGFTNNNPTSLGSFWEFLNTNGGQGWLVNCSVTKPIACCK